MSPLPDAEVVDLSERTVMPGFIDSHVHLTMGASDLTRQTLQSPGAARIYRGPEARPLGLCSNALCLTRAVRS